MRTRRSGRLTAMLAVLLGAAMMLGTVHAAVPESDKTSKNIVNPYEKITYALTIQHIDRLAEAYPDLIEVRTIGHTLFGREIRAVRLGKGEAQVLIDGAQHAREWMGTNLILYLIDRYAYAYENHVSYDGYDVRDILDRCSIWLVPMVNPDGVALQQEGLNAFPDYWHASLAVMNGHSVNFARWKANAQGIDVNRQYPAMWDGIRNSPAYPGYKNYKGTAPAETAEAAAMIRFVSETDPEIALSYHSSGEVLYWHFNTLSEHLARDTNMADTISAMTGYGLMKPEKNPSGGGFTDWFIMRFGRPGFTAEIGAYHAETELPLWTFADIWEDNKNVGLYLASEGYKLWRERYPVENVEEKLQLLKEVQLYSRPKEGYPVGAKLGPAKVTAEARLGNWYRVPTWLGPKWIQLDAGSYLQGHSETYKERIKLTDQTPLYPSPQSDESAILAQLDPQEVDALERWNDWLLIRTWLGDAWIKQHE
ncbi:M14 family zinc carboxypeptidase [Paenibacillus oceani]|uniref:Gamma-D-glutamyl-meso-diaminopimelate peptidase n=1 Tax=Paenibacillus oceani TaxID=2772510 RepID=A0A927C5Z6_9BACL|nr:M14 family zinc carboxypeptidase [Paenibacillus oceani]MBD2860617.1 gamma-D-glutamyl-meso-diaminopimelate peptidase [Paenibacillus oceani]